MEKTFTRAGTSRLHGVVAYRFANDRQRERTLAKTGHTEIEMLELGEPMTKAAAIEYLQSLGIVAQVGSVRNPESGTVTVRKTVTTKPKPVVAAPVVDEDGFVEPTDERVQVAMTRLARQHPGMSAENLLKQVQLTMKHFGDTEPNF